MNSARVRLIYLILAISAAICGIASRSYGAILPRFVAEYAGDTLWAFVVFLSVSLVTPQAPVLVRSGIALALAFAIELSQLYHAPWIEALRDTTVGGLLLGFGFLWTDLVCYTTGILCGVIVDCIVRRDRPPGFSRTRRAGSDSDQQGR